MALRAILKDQVAKNQVSTGYTDISGEETVESTSIPSSDKHHPSPAAAPAAAMAAAASNLQHMAECNYPMNMDDYNNTVMMPPYWATSMPSCP